MKEKPPATGAFFVCWTITMSRRNLAAMKYLTKAEYARLKGITKSAVSDRIRRKTLPVVKIKEFVDRIPVEDIELNGVKP